RDRRRVRIGSGLELAVQRLLGPRLRGFAGYLLLGALVGMLVWQDAASGAPDDNPAQTRGAAASPAKPARGPLFVVLRIAEALQLNDEQTVKLAGAFRRIAEQRRTLLAEKAALETKLTAELGKKPPDETTLSSLTDQLVAQEHDIAALPESLWKSIQPVLT